MNEDLPSINDFIEDRSNLPSINDFIEETHEGEDNIVVNMDGGVGGSWTIQEEVQTIEDADGNSFAEVKDVIPPFPELIRMINDIRKDIPDIPEIKSYDEELYQLTCLIEELRKDIPEIPEFPEVKYYDEEIQELKESIPTVPEVKYYDADIQELKEGLQEVKERDIPDFRWISKSFTVIDEDFENVNSSIATLKGKLTREVSDIVESIEVTKFESKVESQRIDSRVDTAEESIDTSKRELTEKINEVKDKIYEQLRDSSLEIWKLNKEYKNEDKKLKEETLNQYKTLKENLQSTIDGIVKKSDKDYIEVNEYFQSLKKEVSNLPKVKYYDEDIKKVNQSVDSVRNLVEVLENKLNKKIDGLKESILVVPPTENNTDPLTPLDQNFATLDDLSNHYRLFLNRIQKQLATLGGGGEVRLEFLDDVDRDTALIDKRVLQYDASAGIWTGGLGQEQVTLLSELTNDVGFVTNRIVGDFEVTGQVTVGGTFFKETVTDIDSIGIITARDGVNAAGVITATSFSGDGSSLVGVVTEGIATAGQILQHNGTEIVGVSSVGLATYFNDRHQGYYRYSTNYYTTGVANTIQNIPADEFILVQPSVRTNRTTYMPQVMLDANNGDPWIGAGATIGTGHTTFSLAGLDEGSTVIVRIASQFNPDIDNTNVDFKLEFTTNPTTQGFGVTNFDITREQALVCNEGAEQPYITETLMNFYVGNSLSGMTTETAGYFKLCVRASDEGEFEMMALTINVVA